MSRRRQKRALVVHSMSDLVAALRVLKGDEGLTMTQLDALADLQFGYAAKLFSSPASRAHRPLTDFSLPRLLAALGAKMILTNADGIPIHASAKDGAQGTELMAENAVDAWKKRRAALSERGRAGAAKRWGRLGKKSRAKHAIKMNDARWQEKRARRQKERRSAVASKAARARWDKAGARHGEGTGETDQASGSVSGSAAEGSGR